MRVEYKTVSLADQVFERLEAEILSGKYQRGEVVTELQLCAELGVSRTPVREALRRLSQEHLIEESPRGTVVLGVVRKDFEDMCAIRLRIEGLAVRGFIDNLTDDSLRELREAARGLLRHDTYDDSRVAEYLDAHARMLERRTITYTLPVDAALAAHLARMTPMLADVDLSALDLSGVTEITIDMNLYAGTPGARGTEEA